jgi:hypothetical protein
MNSRKDAKTPSGKAAKRRSSYTIVFEDHGQDFLEWDIRGDRVVDSRFQAWAWCNRTVLQHPRRVGDRITIGTEAGEPLQIKYPVVKIIQPMKRRVRA